MENESLSTPAATEAETAMHNNKALPMKQDSRFEKYWKMKCVGLPEGAIRNSITRDGKDASIWDLDWDRNYEEQTVPSFPITDLPMKQDSRFEKYWKMKSVGLPEGAIRNAITRDGKDASIWDLDWDRSYEEQEAPSPTILDLPMKQDSRFEKYWKMKCVGLPEGAIRNAITRDGKNGAIWDLDWDKNYEEQTQSEKSAAPAMKDDSRFEKYWKMKSVGLPDGAIRNAMLRDGVDGSILDLNWEMNYETQTQKGMDDSTSIKDDPRYEKYWKMKLMGLPDGAIRNAMIRDGADVSVLDLDWEKSLASQSTKTKDDGVPLKDDPEYSKFFRMLDMGLTKDAVKNALAREGKDPAIMELDPNKSVRTQKQSNGVSRPRTSIIPQKRVRRKKIFWKPIDPGQIKEDSLWSLVRGGSMSLLKFDAEEFEELFTESADPNESNEKKKAASAGKVKTKKAVQVIDGKRSMNGGIILLRLRMEYKKIASIVRKMYVLGTTCDGRI
jgi:Subunit CCDC53 of WASH complex/Formin Homology 2 Domain